MKERRVSFGVFNYNEVFKSYELDDGKINWSLQPENEDEQTLQKLILTAEKLHRDLTEFVPRAKAAVAEELLEYKNDFWPEYDEDDENLDWDAVEAGEFAVTKEKFEAVITLLDIEIRRSQIYCEYDDGELFGGHRIHAYFDYNYKLIQADI